MHVVVVADHAYVNGGLSKVAIDSAVGLAGRGYEITFFAAVGPCDPRLPEAGIEVILLDQCDEASSASLFRFGLQWLWNLKALEALHRLLAGCDPSDTIVHVHGWSKALSPSIGRAIASLGIPTVQTMHDFSLVCPNGGFYDYHAGGACGLAPMSKACVSHNCDSRSYGRKLLRVLRFGALRHASHLLDQPLDVITISALQREVAARFLPPNAVFHSLDNPIDVEDLGPKTEATMLGGFVFVGRLSPEKGPALFAEACLRLGVQATFIGDGGLRGSLQAKYPDASILGWTGPTETRRLLRQARALVFPSVWYEGQPLVVREAMALGTPVVVSNISSGREAISDGIDGRWFRSGDPGALAEAMRPLCDETVVRSMGMEAYRTYWSHPLTLKRHLDSLLGIYDLVSKRRDSRHTCSALGQRVPFAQC